MSVLRRSGRPRPNSSLRCLRRLRDAIDWGYLSFVVAVVATGLVALHIAMHGGLS